MSCVTAVSGSGAPRATSCSGPDSGCHVPEEAAQLEPRHKFEDTVRGRCLWTIDVYLPRPVLGGMRGVCWALKMGLFLHAVGSVSPTESAPEGVRLEGKVPNQNCWLKPQTGRHTFYP